MSFKYMYHSRALNSHTIAFESHRKSSDAHSSQHIIAYYSIAYNMLSTQFMNVMILFQKINVYIADQQWNYFFKYLTSKCWKLFFMWRHFFFCLNSIAQHTISHIIRPFNSIYHSIKHKSQSISFYVPQHIIKISYNSIA